MLRLISCAATIVCLAATLQASGPQVETLSGARGGRVAASRALPTLAEVSAVLNLDELKPQGQEAGVFVGRGALSYSTTESIAAAGQRVRQQLAKQGWRPGASRNIEMQSVTFMKDERPATIMVYGATEPNKAVIQRYSWQEVDLSALTELPGAAQLSHTKDSLQYAVPQTVEKAAQALQKKLKTLRWPIARTSKTHGVVTEFVKNGLRCTGQVTQMSSHEFEMKPGGTTTTTSVYVMSGPHVDVEALPTPNLVERLADLSFSGGQSKAYLAKGDPKSVSKACRKELQLRGWMPVIPIRGGTVEVQELFVQRGCLLQLRADPAQDGMSEVNYYATMLPFDLPSMGVKSVRVDSAAPHLTFVATSSELDELTSFYENHLVKSGWTMNADQRFDSPKKHLRVFHGTHYQPVFMEIQRKGTEIWVELRPVDETQIAALLVKAERGVGTPTVEAEQTAARSTSDPAAPPESKVPTADGLEAEIAHQLQQAFQQAFQQAAEGLESVDNKEAKNMLADLQKALSAAAAGEEAAAGLQAALSEALPEGLGDALSRAVDDPTPQPNGRREPRVAKQPPLDETHGVLGEKFPIPRDAQKLKRQPDMQSISYYTATVGPHAAFFARELKKLGFRPRGKRDIQDDFAFMRFQKGNGTVQISMYADDRNEVPVRVMINGDGLLWPGVADEFGLVAEEVADEPSNNDFDTPTEHAGIPLPDRLTEIQTSGSPFLAEATGTKRTTLATLLAFYRKELPARGWKEVTARSVVSKDKVQIVFSTADAHVGVQIEQFGDEVDFKIRKRDAKKAQAAGVVPARGKARIVLVNSSEHDATLTIGDTTVAIAAEVGMRDPAKGKKFDVAPGTHRFTIEVQGDKIEDRVKVSAGGAWAIVVAPEIGHMADRVY